MPPVDVKASIQQSSAQSLDFGDVGGTSFSGGTINRGPVSTGISPVMLAVVAAVALLIYLKVR